MSSCSLDKLELSCTWDTANERSIKDTITIELSDNKELKSDVDDLVRLETCVQLFIPNSSSCTPELIFNVTPDLNISAIKVISEARIIELYGQGGEYLSTTHSDFVDDFEGMAVYSTLVKLDIPTHECSIKFNKLKHQDNFWLYGIGIYVEECKTLKCASTLVDLNIVSDRLQQSGCSLTENAGECMKLLQTFQMLGKSNSKNSGNGDDLDGRDSHKVLASETSKKLCDLLLHMPPLHNRSKTLSSPESALPEELKKLSLSESATADLQILISEHFKKLEKSLMGRMDERLNVIEQKIDLLTSLLQKQDHNVQTDQDVKK